MARTVVRESANRSNEGKKPVLSPGRTADVRAVGGEFEVVHESLEEETRKVTSVLNVYARQGIDTKLPKYRDIRVLRELSKVSSEAKSAPEVAAYAAAAMKRALENRDGKAVEILVRDVPAAAALRTDPAFLELAHRFPREYFTPSTESRLQFYQSIYYGIGADFLGPEEHLTAILKEFPMPQEELVGLVKRYLVSLADGIAPPTAETTHKGTAEDADMLSSTWHDIAPLVGADLAGDPELGAAIAGRIRKALADRRSGDTSNLLRIARLFPAPEGFWQDEEIQRNAGGMVESIMLNGRSSEAMELAIIAGLPKEFVDRLVKEKEDDIMKSRHKEVATLDLQDFRGGLEYGRTRERFREALEDGPLDRFEALIEPIKNRMYYSGLIDKDMLATRFARGAKDGSIPLEQAMRILEKAQFKEDIGYPMYKYLRDGYVAIVRAHVLREADPDVARKALGPLKKEEINGILAAAPSPAYAEAIRATLPRWVSEERDT